MAVPSPPAMPPHSLAEAKRGRGVTFPHPQKHWRVRPPGSILLSVTAAYILSAPPQADESSGRSAVLQEPPGPPPLGVRMAVLTPSPEHFLFLQSKLLHLGDELSSLHKLSATSQEEERQGGEGGEHKRDTLRFDLEAARTEILCLQAELEDMERALSGVWRILFGYHRERDTLCFDVDGLREKLDLT